MIRVCVRSFLHKNCISIALFLLIFSLHFTSYFFLNSVTVIFYSNFNIFSIFFLLFPPKLMSVAFDFFNPRLLTDFTILGKFFSNFRSLLLFFLIHEQKNPNSQHCLSSTLSTVLQIPPAPYITKPPLHKYQETTLQTSKERFFFFFFFYQFCFKELTLII